MVVFMLKWAFASIPAAVIMLVIVFSLMVVFSLLLSVVLAALGVKPWW
jgi:hypothetical protein